MLPLPFRTLRCALYGLALSIAMTGSILPVYAQGGVPQVLLDSKRRLQGDALQICIDEHSAGAAFDRAVAQAVGDALLLDVTFHPAPTGFPLDGAGYLDELHIVMNNTCDVLVGISLQPNSPFPDWATVTRAYASVPFVLVVKDPAFQSLADMPKDKMIGTALGSVGEAAFITYMMQQSPQNRWKRLPYADPALMLRRLHDGNLQGMVIWQPSLLKILSTTPEQAGLRIIPTTPVRESVAHLGMLVSNRDIYLRNQIDKAIDSLIADGTITELLRTHGYAGKAGL